MTGRSGRWLGVARIGVPTLLIVGAVIALVSAASRNGNKNRTGTHPPSAYGHVRSGKRHHSRVVPIPKHPLDLSALIGQTIVARFYGTQPSHGLLARIEAGEIGGVILYGENTAGGLDAVRTLDRRLQRAATHGGHPPLLIMTDQEGGTVKRLTGPPVLAAAEMSSTSIAQQQGVETGRLLRSVGINVDLAPVVDVEATDGPSFLGTRSFGSNANLVAAHACAFASGLASQDVAYTLKHFPGLGLAATSTDIAPVSVNATAGVLRGDYLPYLECASGQRALVMVDSASYPTLSDPLPAVISPEIYQRELHIAIQGDPPVTISDNLETPALASIPAPGLRAVNAGLDLTLYATTELGSATAYRQLLADARTDKLNLTRIRAAVAKIEDLKRMLR